MAKTISSLEHLTYSKTYFSSSSYECLEHNSRNLYCGYFHLEQSWNKPEGGYPPPPPLMSKHPTHSSHPAADLAVLQ